MVLVGVGVVSNFGTEAYTAPVTMVSQYFCSVYSVRHPNPSTLHSLSQKALDFLLKILLRQVLKSMVNLSF